MKEELIELARAFWLSEMDRIGPDWDTAEIMADFATSVVREREAEIAAELTAIVYRPKRDYPNQTVMQVATFIKRLESGRTPEEQG